EVDGGVCVTQLFGDYEPATGQIRVFLRTAITGKVVRPRAFLCTLLHEFCHHLDVRFFGRRSSFHTRGFFGRVDGLYHRALGTPEAERRPLHWVPAGDVWRIDWPAMRRGGEGGRAGLGLGGLRARGRARVRRGSVRAGCGCGGGRFGPSASAASG
ncbi:MAG TPA: hypothetical protein VFS00_01185, partial [Polyangiaceae bacterium]|nr:hypothetical protein [Polyangiaceae bacterium]